PRRAVQVQALDIGRVVGGLWRVDGDVTATAEGDRDIREHRAAQCQVRRARSLREEAHRGPYIPGTHGPEVVVADSPVRRVVRPQLILHLPDHLLGLVWLPDVV